MQYHEFSRGKLKEPYFWQVLAYQITAVSYLISTVIAHDEAKRIIGNDRIKELRRAKDRLSVGQDALAERMVQFGAAKTPVSLDRFRTLAEIDMGKVDGFVKSRYKLARHAVKQDKELTNWYEVGYLLASIRDLLIIVGTDRATQALLRKAELTTSIVSAQNHVDKVRSDCDNWMTLVEAKGFHTEVFYPRNDVRQTENYDEFLAMMAKRAEILAKKKTKNVA